MYVVLRLPCDVLMSCPVCTGPSLRNMDGWMFNSVLFDIFLVDSVFQNVFSVHNTFRNYSEWVFLGVIVSLFEVTKWISSVFLMVVEHFGTSVSSQRLLSILSLMISSPLRLTRISNRPVHPLPGAVLKLL